MFHLVLAHALFQNHCPLQRQGAKQELELSGSMRAQFCAETNRLEHAKIQFDTGIIQSQIRYA